MAIPNQSIFHDISKIMRIILLTISLIVCPTLIYAHGADGHPFVAGLTHPILGVDHLLAIITTAILGHTLLEEKQWLPTILFILAMIIGGFLGINGTEINYMELIIQASVVVLGLIVWGNIKLTLVGFALIAMVFGFTHGLAHGLEMPNDASPALYVTGYVLGAALVSAAGYFLIRIFTSGIGIRTLGAFVCGMGAALLLS